MRWCNLGEQGLGGRGGEEVGQVGDEDGFGVGVGEVGVGEVAGPDGGDRVGGDGHGGAAGDGRRHKHRAKWWFPARGESYQRPMRKILPFFKIMLFYSIFQIMTFSLKKMTLFICL